MEPKPEYKFEGTVSNLVVCKGCGAIIGYNKNDDILVVDGTNILVGAGACNCGTTWVWPEGLDKHVSIPTLIFLIDKIKEICKFGFGQITLVISGGKVGNILPAASHWPDREIGQNDYAYGSAYLYKAEEKRSHGK